MKGRFKESALVHEDVASHGGVRHGGRDAAALDRFLFLDAAKRRGRGAAGQESRVDRLRCRRIRASAFQEPDGDRAQGERVLQPGHRSCKVRSRKQAPTTSASAANSTSHAQGAFASSSTDRAGSSSSRTASTSPSKIATSIPMIVGIWGSLLSAPCCRKMSICFGTRASSRSMRPQTPFRSRSRTRTATARAASGCSWQHDRRCR